MFGLTRVRHLALDCLTCRAYVDVSVFFVPGEAFARKQIARAKADHRRECMNPPAIMVEWAWEGAVR